MEKAEEELFIKKEELLKKYGCQTIEELLQKLELLIQAQQIVIKTRDTAR